MRKMLARPSKGDNNPYYDSYINKVPDGDILEYLIAQKIRFVDFIQDMNDNKLDYKYAEDKWTLRQGIMHIIETERIFAYRALAVSRGESKNLPGFDQDAYVDNNKVAHLDKEYLWQDFAITRNASMIMFKGFTDFHWEKMGMMSDNPFRVRAIPFILAGHLEHHKRIFVEKYLL